MQRDFTYVDDVVEGIVRVLAVKPAPDPSWCGDRPDPGTSRAPYRIYNIGNNRPVELLRYIRSGDPPGRKAKKNLLPLHPRRPGHAGRHRDLVRDFDYRPATTVDEGVTRFVEWYLSYYKVS
jgi:UDP-glucuronate 4-epimerase